MAFDDLPLHEPAPPAPPGPAPPRPPAGPSRWIVLGASVVMAGALLAMWWLAHAQPVPTAPAFTNATDVSVASPRPKSQPMDLPPLDDSDPLLRRLLSVLSTHPLLARLLATPAIVRNATLAVVQVGDGKTPAASFSVLRPTTRLTITGTASGPIDPKSYRRWDAQTAALVSLPPGDVAQVYVNVKQLFDQAYRDLGNLNNDFDRAIVRAIQTLDDTPRPATEPVLLSRPGYFEHDDPALKALLPVQRQFLLVGPENQRQILGWLKRLASSLDLKIR
jgi:hypothetical protein